MHVPLPEQIDVERAVATGRIYAGSFPLANLPRLTSLLAGSDGEVRFELKFGRNVIEQRMVEMLVETGFPLVCQTSLDTFVLPVQIDTRLGFVKDEADDAGLPEGFEPALTEAGMVDPAALIEDELILAVPVVPRKPGAAVKQPTMESEGEAVDERPHPFAGLASLKRK